MENLIGGLILAAVGGLTYIAYKHHEAFSNIAGWLIGLTFISAFVITVYDTGIREASSALRPMLSPDRFEEARTAIESISLSSGYVSLWLIGIFLYLMLLWWLPEILGLSKNDPEN